LSGDGKARKRILYLSAVDPTLVVTGATVRMNAFVRFLARRYDIDIVCLAGSGHKPDYAGSDESLVSLVGRFTRIGFKQNRYFLFSKRLYAEASSLLRQQHYDLLITEYGLSAVYGLLLKRHHDIPWIYSSHNIEFKMYVGKIRDDLRRIPLVPYVWLIERLACKRADLIIAVSDSDAEFYRERFGARNLIVIPQGFDDTVYNPHYEPEASAERTLLYFGNFKISLNRQAARLIRVHLADQVTKERRDVFFQFVGANPPTHLKHPHFRFEGFVDDLAGCIRNADLVISPTVRGWGMPTKLIESLACGKHVVATEIAARGIPRKYRNLHTSTLAEMPQVILRLLEQEEKVSSNQFDEFRNEFAWVPNLERLDRRMQQLIAATR
jgi:glycosyltransferase involved in cell wall biosynthesis